MTKKLKLLFVVCFVSIALGLSAGKAHAASIAIADAQLRTEGLTGPRIPVWNASFSVALAAIDVPLVVGPVVDIKPGIVPTFAAAGIPGPIAAGVAGTNQLLFNPTVPPSVPGLMQAISAAFPVYPNSALAFSAAGYLGKFTSVAQGPRPFGVGAVDQVILDLSTDYIGEHAAGFAIAGVFVKNLSLHTFSLDYDLVYDGVWDGDDSYLLDYSGGIRPPLWASTGFRPGDQGIWGAFVATGVKAEPVPEPATMALFGIGLVGLVGAGARRKFKKEKKQISNT